MKKTITLFSLLLLTVASFAQKKTTASATVSFDATTPKDNLPKAENKSVIGSINTQTGEVAFEAAVNNFSFSNPRMQEHFNGDSWMKSGTFPVIAYTGKISDAKKINFTKDGEYKVKVEGDMKIRDITKKEKIEGLISVSGGKIRVSAVFKIKLEDYKITGVPVDAGKVAKEPLVTVSAEF